MSFSGLFDVKITRSSLSESLVIATSSAISVTTNANNSLSVSDVSILRTEDYSNSSYVIESNGSINDDSLGGLYTFEQVSPWKRYLLELPYEGELLVKSIESDTVVLKSVLEASAENLFMTQNGETVPIILEDITLGAFWAFQNKTTKTPIPFSTENFDFIGSLFNDILRDFPVLGEFKLLFSRPIEKVELFGEKFGSLGWPQVTTLASSEIDGNIAIVTPAVPLEPNLSYSIPLVRAFGLSGKSDIFEQERPLRTNDSITPLIEATSFI
jgi:hypothetical protein